MRFKRADLSTQADPGLDRGGLASQVVERVAARLLGSTGAEVVIDHVVEALLRSPALARLIDRVVGELRDSSEVKALVDAQVERVLRELRGSEALAQLVEEEATRYLALLEQNPDRIRGLLQVQSRDAVTGFLDPLRRRALAADDALEKVFRRAPGRG